MSALTLAQTLTAVGPNRGASFLAAGGTPAYTYSVRPNGAGGSIGASSGLYTSPLTISSHPEQAYDTIQVKDSVGTITTARILVGNPLMLFCEILQKELSLDEGRVYLWDQKIMQFTDTDLYIAIGISSCKPFANTIRPDSSDWSSSYQALNMLATLEIDIMSRGPAARDRKEEVMLALNSVYAQAQQEANGFYIAKLSPGGGFTNLSLVDGAAIPYRFHITANIQYAVSKSKAVPYFGTFQTVQEATNP